MTTVTLQDVVYDRIAHVSESDYEKYNELMFLAEELVGQLKITCDQLSHLDVSDEQRRIADQMMINAGRAYYLPFEYLYHRGLISDK